MAMTVHMGKRCPGCHVVAMPDVEHRVDCEFQGAGALELLPPRLGIVPKRHRGSLAKLSRGRWVGAADGHIEGSTQVALARIGVAETRWSDDPGMPPSAIRYRRLVSRLTPLGEAYLTAHPQKEEN